MEKAGASSPPPSVNARCLVSASEEYHHVVKQCGQRTDGGHHVGVGSRGECAHGHLVVVGRGDACAAEPLRGAAAGINLDGQGHETEECGQGEESNADEQQRGEYFNEQDACQQHSLHRVRSETNHRHEGRAQLQGSIGHGVLHGMATFVGGYGSGSHRIAVIDALAQVDRAVCRVVVVGQVARRTGHADVVDAVVAQHLLSHFAARHSAVEGYLRVLLEFALKVGLHHPTEDGHAKEND